VVVDEKTAAKKVLEEESFKLQNEWAEEDTKRFEADESRKVFEKILQASTKEKGIAEKALKEVEDVIATFETSKDPPAPVEEVAAAVEDPEATDATAMEVVVPTPAMVEAC